MLSLYSKLGGVSAPELGEGTTVGGDPNGTSESEGNLHGEVFSNIHTLRSRRWRHDMLGTKDMIESTAYSLT